MTAKRQPNEADLLALVKSLTACKVEYVVIGGAAMALHGFPRMTKDIDLLLPVDSENNKRLMSALSSMFSEETVARSLRSEWMDKGFSTAFEDEIFIDLLYVAADKSIEDFRRHIRTVVLKGVPVSTLDVDGMLMSKATTREEDIPDRLKLGRLKNTQIQLEVLRRIDALPNLATAIGVEYVLWRHAAEAIQESGRTGTLIWRAAEEAVIKECLSVGHQVDVIAEAISRHSPGCPSVGKREEVIALIARIVREGESEKCRENTLDDEAAPK